MSGAHSQSEAAHAPKQPRPDTVVADRHQLMAVAVVAVGFAAVAIRANHRAAASPTSSPAAEIGVTTDRSVPHRLGDARRRDHPGAERRHRHRPVLRAARRPLPHPVAEPGGGRQLAAGDPEHVRLRRLRAAGAVGHRDGHRARRLRRGDERDRRTWPPAPPSSSPSPPGRRSASSSCWPSSATSRSPSRRPDRSRPPGGGTTPGGHVRLAVERAGLAGRTVDAWAAPTSSPRARS